MSGLLWDDKSGNTANQLVDPNMYTYGSDGTGSAAQNRVAAASTTTPANTATSTSNNSGGPSDPFFSGSQPTSSVNPLSSLFGDKGFFGLGNTVPDTTTPDPTRSDYNQRMYALTNNYGTGEQNGSLSPTLSKEESWSKFMSDKYGPDMSNQGLTGAFNNFGKGMDAAGRQSSQDWTDGKYARSIIAGSPYGRLIAGVGQALDTPAPHQAPDYDYGKMQQLEGPAATSRFGKENDATWSDGGTIYHNANPAKGTVWNWNNSENTAAEEAYRQSTPEVMEANRLAAIDADVAANPGKQTSFSTMRPGSYYEGDTDWQGKPYDSSSQAAVDFENSRLNALEGIGWGDTESQLIKATTPGAETTTVKTPTVGVATSSSSDYTNPYSNTDTTTLDGAFGTTNSSYKSNNDGTGTFSSNEMGDTAVKDYGGGYYSIDSGDGREIGVEDPNSKSNGGSGSSGGGGGGDSSYIATAATQALGEEGLTVFNNWRDRMRRLHPSEFSIAFARYRITAPKIVAEIDTKEDSKGIYKDIWDNHLKPIYNLIVKDKDSIKAQDDYRVMVRELSNKYLKKGD